MNKNKISALIKTSAFLRVEKPWALPKAFLTV